MDKEIKKGIKKLFFVDSLITTINSLNNIMDEAEKEIDEILGKHNKIKGYENTKERNHY